LRFELPTTLKDRRSNGQPLVKQQEKMMKRLALPVLMMVLLGHIGSARAWNCKIIDRHGREIWGNVHLECKPPQPFQPGAVAQECAAHYSLLGINSYGSLYLIPPDLNGSAQLSDNNKFFVNGIIEHKTYNAMHILWNNGQNAPPWFGIPTWWHCYQ
jgi:hypothetical protein